MDVGEVLRICQRAARRLPQRATRIAFRNDNLVVHDSLDNRHMAIYAAGTRLAGGEHDDVTHARRVVDGIAQRLCGSSPVPGIAEIRTDGQSQLVAAFIRPPCALAPRISIAAITGADQDGGV